MSSKGDTSNILSPLNSTLTFNTTMKLYPTFCIKKKKKNPLLGLTLKEIL